ncbi:hypothetical protein G6F31_016217 [Rhizopus arrhizus]|nr:hypothetical protein G6F31_016217 [Rhizopus arrhizus]
MPYSSPSIMRQTRSRVEGADAHHGSEDLFVRQFHGIRDARQQRRLIQQGAGLAQLAARQQRGAMRGGVGHQARHLVDCALVDQRALRHAVFQPAAHFHAADLGQQLGVERVYHAGVHVDAVGAYAGLAGVAELGQHQPLHRLVQVSVLEHDERRVAAQFQRQLLDVGGALLHQQAPRLRRAGERQLAHRGVLGRRWRCRWSCWC